MNLPMLFSPFGYSPRFWKEMVGLTYIMPWLFSCVFRSQLCQSSQIFWSRRLWRKTLRHLPFFGFPISVFSHLLSFYSQLVSPYPTLYLRMTLDGSTDELSKLRRLHLCLLASMSFFFFFFSTWHFGVDVLGGESLVIIGAFP